MTTIQLEVNSFVFDEEQIKVEESLNNKHFLIPGYYDNEDFTRTFSFTESQLEKFITHKKVLLEAQLLALKKITDLITDYKK